MDPIALTGQHSKACGQSCCRTDHQKHDRSCGTDSCQRTETYKPSNDHGIYRIINLLEYIS